MKGIRALFKSVGGGRRPPTGPMTTAETADAEELRLKTLATSQREPAKTGSD